MKNFFLYTLLLFTLYHTSSFAQKRANIWYFSNFAGVDFNSGAPVALSNSALSTGEGCAAICDTSGSLLFYTDGTTVWNKNHISMPNGFSLHGNYSSSQSSLIIPMPGSDSLYYLFTTDAEAGAFGLEYSIVDMSLQGGLGDVSVKNVFLNAPVGEKLTATQQTGTNDVWIVTHEYFTANFYSYLLTSTGVNTTPVITNVGSIHTGFNNDNAIGYMKISPTGTKLALALSRSQYFELFDFDASTGIPSNPIILPATNLTYGIEFSRDAKILYASEFNNKIYQFDLTAGSASAIIASQILIGTPNAIEIGSIQMAPDGKIYVVKNSDTHLAVINEPDSLGLACDFVDNAFQLASGTAGIEGLPNFSPTFFINATSLLPQSNLQATDTDICEKFCISFSDASTNNPTSWDWQFPGGTPSSSTVQNPSNICYQAPGSFDVTLITTNANGSDTLSLTNFITVNPTPPFPTITQNGFTLTSSVASTYQWQLNSVDIPGATNQSYDVQQSGLYTVVITDQNGCTSSSSSYLLIEGIEDVSSDPTVSIYPNPSNGSFILELSRLNRDQVADELRLNIYSTLGQLVFSSEEKIHDHFSKAIDASELAPGVYFLEARMDQIIVKKKLVISK